MVRLRGLEPGDGDAVHALISRMDVVRHMLLPLCSREESEKFLRDSLLESPSDPWRSIDQSFAQAPRRTRIQVHQFAMQRVQRVLGFGVVFQCVGGIQLLGHPRLLLLGQMIQHVAPLVNLTARLRVSPAVIATPPVRSITWYRVRIGFVRPTPLHGPFHSQTVPSLFSAML